MGDDNRFGKFRWRPLERFVLQQGSKYRAIDSGKRPLHNSASRERETIYVSSVDTLVAMCLETRLLAAKAPLFQESPSLAQFVLGTEDMKHAYRQCPVAPEHLCVSCVCYWDTSARDHRYLILRGLPFGLSSSVLSFNRLPTMLTALARRTCAAGALAFFDDAGIFDLLCARGSAQAALRLIYQLAGAQLDPTKSQPPAACRVFLGLSINLAVAFRQNQVSFDLKPGYRREIFEFVQAIFLEGRLGSGNAAKLRGKFGWAATGTFGRCGRGGLAPLVRRQYHDDTDLLTPSLADCLTFHATLAEWVPPRLALLRHVAPPPVRVYSGASFELQASTQARLGFVVFPASTSVTPVGMSVDVPVDVLAQLVPRQQQIAVCEAVLGVVVPYNVPHLLSGCDVIWYIDNQSACQLLVKGSSSHEDMSVVAALTHLMLARLGCRVYFEYIESEANPSDGLSRDGLLDSWTQAQGWTLLQAELPPFLHGAFDSLSAALCLV